MFYNPKFKKVMAIVIIALVVAMVATMVLPYLV